MTSKGTSPETSGPSRKRSLSEPRMVPKKRVRFVSPIKTHSMVLRSEVSSSKRKSPSSESNQPSHKRARREASDSFNSNILYVNPCREEKTDPIQKLDKKPNVSIVAGFLEAYINEQKVEFLVDSGSPYTKLDSKMARHLGLHHMPCTKEKIKWTDWHVTRKIKVKCIKNVEITLLNGRQVYTDIYYLTRTLDKHNPRLNILGRNTLTQLRCIQQCASLVGRLYFNDLLRLKRTFRNKIHKAKIVLKAYAEISIQSRCFNVVIDTGLPGSYYISEGLGRELGMRTQAPYLDLYLFDGVALWGSVCFDMPKDVGENVHIIMGWEVLARFNATINYHHNRVHFYVNHGVYTAEIFDLN